MINQVYNIIMYRRKTSRKIQHLNCPTAVHHATDEEKLASTVMGQKDGLEEFSDCTKTTTSTKNADGEGKLWACYCSVYSIVAVLILR